MGATTFKHRTEVTQMWVAEWTLGWINFWEEFFPNDHTPFTARTFPG